MTLTYDLQDAAILGNRLKVHKLSLYNQLHVNLQVSQNKKQQKSLI